jgi:hypothetical protein
MTSSNEMTSNKAATLDTATVLSLSSRVLTTARVSGSVKRLEP